MRSQSECILHTWLHARAHHGAPLPLSPTGAHLHEILEFDKAVGAMLRFAEQVIAIDTGLKWMATDGCLWPLMATDGH